MPDAETSRAARDRSDSSPGRARLTSARVVVRATRSHTVDQALTGLGVVRLSAYKVKDLPAEARPAGYMLHDTRHPSGAVVAILTACGPDRTTLMARLRSHLEQPSVGYSVEHLEGLTDDQAVVRRANADELRRRRAGALASSAEPAAAARPRQRQKPEEAGQKGLF
ncbi:hypothetical protein ACODT5_00830 [Streptomyces sp. 5.8]|uniref:hypothetical protein n=1 Tax=Streptomyces sp. 5.8 TaxID=3406571 RepID=UPI003BB5A097